MGAALPAVDVGSGRTVSQVACGHYHTCALLDDSSVKCWGHNSHGQLGQEDTISRGASAGEMGDALPLIKLGSGRRALSVCTGSSHSCALFDDGSVKCWGSNADGQLGLGDSDARGDSDLEMGDALPAVNLGTGRTAVSIGCGGWSLSAASSGGFTCALLDTGSVKCWGGNFRGRLGRAGGSAGTNAGELGDALLPVDLGSGRTAQKLSVGDTHACALLDSGGVKCWGDNTDGALGIGDREHRGVSEGDMGDALPAIDFGGEVPVRVEAGGKASCAVLDGGSLKCWGWGLNGGLGQESTEDVGGESGGEVAALAAVDLGGGRRVVGYAHGDTFGCAALEGGEVKCFGDNEFGQLGLGVSAHAVGYRAGEMGDALAAVDLRAAEGGGEGWCEEGAVHCECAGTGEGRRCGCAAGFRGDGRACGDEDECGAGAHSCEEGVGVCGNTFGSFECACLPGYLLADDGTSCEEAPAEGCDALCGPHAECVDGECQCDAGFAWPVAGGGEAGAECGDVDECALLGGGACGAHAACRNTEGSFACECDAGFSAGGGGGCENEDECAGGRGACGGRATCVDTEGSFVCECGVGLALDRDARGCSEEALVVIFAVLDLPRTEFDAARQLAYRRAVATVAGVGDDDVELTSVTAVEAAGRRTLLLGEGTAVATTLRSIAAHAKAATTANLLNALPAHLNAAGLPLASLSVSPPSLPQEAGELEGAAALAPSGDDEADGGGFPVTTVAAASGAAVVALATCFGCCLWRWWPRRVHQSEEAPHFAHLLFDLRQDSRFGDANSSFSKRPPSTGTSSSHPSLPEPPAPLDDSDGPVMGSVLHPPDLLRPASSSAVFPWAVPALPTGKQFHVFISHDILDGAGGDDAEARGHRERVARLNRFLVDKGVKTWFEEAAPSSDMSALFRGIDQSMVFVAAITRRFVERVNGGEEGDRCRSEMELARNCSTVGAQRMLPVVVEQAMARDAAWMAEGYTGCCLRGKRAPMLTSDDDNFAFLAQSVFEALIKTLRRGRRPDPLAPPPPPPGHARCSESGPGLGCTPLALGASAAAAGVAVPASPASPLAATPRAEEASLAFSATSAEVQVASS